VSLGAGLYRKADAQQAVDIDLIALVLRAPLATLCLASALARHELVDTIPSAVDVALPRGTRPPQATAPPVKWHVFAPKHLPARRETVKLDADTSIGSTARNAQLSMPSDCAVWSGPSSAGRRCVPG